MKLEDSAIDELHKCALGEFEPDREAEIALNQAYIAAREVYIEAFLQAHLFCLFAQSASSHWWCVLEGDRSSEGSCLSVVVCVPSMGTKA